MMSELAVCCKPKEPWTALIPALRKIQTLVYLNVFSVNAIASISYQFNKAYPVNTRVCNELWTYPRYPAESIV